MATTLLSHNQKTIRTISYVELCTNWRETNHRECDRDNERHFIEIKGSVHPEDIEIQSYYVHDKSFKMQQAILTQLKKKRKEINSTHNQSWKF